mmetsp:Transcript_142376/g.454281  ORF Transcript_142376/g.454281 Transcript_142376/m.454281 type:complete len:278 (+) Transcript_142376:1183-2016(+)
MTGSAPVRLRWRRLQLVALEPPPAVGVDEPGAAVIDADLASSEVAAEIDPAEAAAVSQQVWASAVEALCARDASQSSASVSASASSALRSMDVVVLVFNRDDFAFDEALLASAVAHRAANRGVDVKPAWANGAKIFVPGIGAEELAEVHIDPRPRYVVALASDQEELLKALTAIPSRRRPRLKPTGPVLAVPTPGDIALFNDVSSSGGGGCSRGAASDHDVESTLPTTSSSSSAAPRSSQDLPLRLESRLPDGLGVRWTFLHFDEPQSDIPQMSRSV